ncbi:hypothetical protein BJ970_003434 [Saccharopolyspora phatthalungensis]|uniref:Uncharacterized protein n=1 Tax=Saccharopolyspora phatthalungensis TaxID=664693 RepID=A0A840Q7R1_9PSEU|nr:hypothetical protein [Saccharopolyspora phatthalungensis]
MRRLGEAVELLAPAGIVVTPLDAGQATAVLAASCNPDTLLPQATGLAGADDIITTPSGGQSDPGYSGWASDADGAPADYDAPADAGFEDDWDYDTEDDEDDFVERGRVA